VDQHVPHRPEYAHVRGAVTDIRRHDLGPHAGKLRDRRASSTSVGRRSGCGSSGWTWPGVGDAYVALWWWTHGPAAILATRP
jgi:hypothetical protein